MEDCVMEDCDNHSQQPWEEAKPKKKTTETLPDDFSTLCRVTISTDGGVEAVMQEIEGEAQEKQQQHGEGKQLKKKMMKKKTTDKKKKKKKNKRGPLRASNTRSFTPEEKEAYHKQVEETEGFGVLDLPFDVITQDVVPCPPRDTDEVMLYRGMAKKALGFYNDDNNGTSYKFVRLIRTNCCCHYVNRTEFFITFQAKDGRAGEMHNFQAHILYFKGETCPLFCRLEPKSKLPEGIEMN
ncbi:hypothetical protein Vadar_024492 [Vaccinium darrowii]|uniref:Uncharacterized protein n=1 Tax=Vaccinium darrowii TaxID=229202 RepID=A0ACB7ZLB6_9ERIC|nr:hypothetical protein Vadar_024492 [Vaccinium darrowii]